MKTIFLKNIYLFFILSYILILISNSYLPNYDESYQIEAALRYFYFSKFEYSWNLPKDLSLQKFDYSIAWPFGYSALIFLFLKLKISLNATLITIKIILIFSNLFIWQKISLLEISEIKFINYFKILFSIFIITISNSTTDMIVVLFFGIITNKILSPKFTIQYLNFTHLGCLLAISFIFKYTTIFLYPSLLIYFIFSNYKERINNILYKLFLFTFPFSITVFLIFIKNYFESNNISTLTNVNTLNKFYFIINYDFFNLLYVIFIESLTFPILINNGLNYFFKLFFLNYIIITFLTFLFLKYYKLKYFKNYNYFSITIFIYIIFLFLFSLYFFTNPTEWLPLSESRYYQPFAGILLIVYLKFVEQLLRYQKRFSFIFIKLIFISIFIFYLIFCYKKISYNTYVNKNILTVEQYINKINSLNKIENNIYFLDNNYFPVFPRDGVHNYFNINKLKNIKILNNRNKYISYILVSNISFKHLPIIQTSSNNNILLFTINNNYKSIIIGNNTTLYWKIYN